MSPKPKKAPIAYDVHVNLDLHPSGAVCYRLLVELIKYLQYARAQIAAPFDQLECFSQVAYALRFSAGTSQLSDC